MNDVKIIQQQKVSEYIPDFIQQTIVKQMEEIDEQIKQHEEAIKELDKIYTAHANFLQRYSPFGARDISQDCPVDTVESPEALPQAERREENGSKVFGNES